MVKTPLKWGILSILYINIYLHIYQHDIHTNVYIYIWCSVDQPPPGLSTRRHGTIYIYICRLICMHIVLICIYTCIWGLHGILLKGLLGSIAVRAQRTASRSFLLAPRPDVWWTPEILCCRILMCLWFVGPPSGACLNSADAWLAALACISR